MLSPSKGSARKFLGNEKGNVAITLWTHVRSARRHDGRVYRLFARPPRHDGTPSRGRRRSNRGRTFAGDEGRDPLCKPLRPISTSTSPKPDCSTMSRQKFRQATLRSWSKPSYTMPTVIMGLIGQDTINVQVVAAARAQVENGGVACLISLSDDSDDALHIQGINQSSSENCWNWANSTNPNAINGSR